MKVTTEALENCEVLMTVELDAKQEGNILQKAARRIARQVKIPGFRPGKAPYNIILNRFGEEAIQEEALKDLTQKVFQDALKEADLDPYLQASLDGVTWKPLVMKVKVPTSPEIDLGDYQNIRLDAPEIEVTDEEVTEQLEQLRQRYSTFVPVERPAQEGDLVSAYVIAKDFETGDVLYEDTEDFTLKTEADDVDNTDETDDVDEVLDDDNEPDFIPLLMGVTAGESVSLIHTYPDSYDDDEFSGKEIDFTLEVTTVKENEDIGLTDELATLVGDFDTLDDLKQNIIDSLTEQKKREADEDLIEEMLTKVLESADLKWPALLEEEQLNQAIRDQEQNLKRYGLDLNIFLKMENKTMDELRTELRGSVVENLKRGLVLNKVVELENLTINREEVLQQANLMIAMSGGSQEAAEIYRSPAGLHYLTSSMLTDKARLRLKAIATGQAEAEENEAKENETEAAETTASTEEADSPEATDTPAEAESPQDKEDAEPAPEVSAEKEAE